MHKKTMAPKGTRQRIVYPAVNNFKLLAALFVIMIHTSPLTSVSTEADFVLTRIIARTAVPFFFLVTGYFVLPKARTALLEGDPGRGLRYLKRIGLLYLASVLLYLPIGLYAGHFRDVGILGLLRMLLTDGTFYHLWYLPALLLGFALIWLGVSYLPLKALCPAAGLFYLLGLFGDSYYGFLKEGSVLFGIYQGIFRISSYTRNGLFFAPAFLLLGYLIFLRCRPGQKRPSQTFVLVGFAVSSGLLLAEGITLRLLEVQRHDSMYLFLLPVMYFLFLLLLDGKGPDLPEFLEQTAPLPANMKSLPLLIYLLHPLFLILVRGFAKITGLTLLTANSLIHFLAVAAASFAGSYLLLILWTLSKNRLFKHHSPRRKANDYKN